MGQQQTRTYSYRLPLYTKALITINISIIAFGYIVEFFIYCQFLCIQIWTFVPSTSTIPCSLSCNQGSGYHRPCEGPSRAGCLDVLLHPSSGIHGVREQYTPIPPGNSQKNKGDSISIHPPNTTKNWDVSNKFFIWMDSL
jgi:hypothetical protein